MTGPSLLKNWGSRHFVAYIGFLIVGTFVTLRSQGLILFPSDYLGWYFPFRGEHIFEPYRAFLPNSHYQDVVFFFFPYWSAAGEFLSQGILPLWSPLEGPGAPSGADHVQGVFFPLHWLTYGSFSPITAWHLELVLTLLTASLSSFYLFRRWSGCAEGATLGALSWSLAGGMAGYFQQAASAWPLALLPLILYGLDDISEGRRRGVWVVGLSVGLLNVVGHLQSTIPVMMIVAGYAMVSSGRKRGLAAIFAGALLAVPHLVPLAELLVLSQRPPLPKEAILNQLLAPGEYLNIFFPFFSGAPSDGFYIGRGLAGQVVNGREHALYVGQIPLLLACLVVFRERKPWMFRLAGFVLLSLILAGSSTLFSTLAFIVKPLWYLTPLRFLQFLHFGTCFLACLGWKTLREKSLTRTEARFLIGVVGVFILGAATYVLPAFVETPGFLYWLVELAQTGINKPPYFEGDFGPVFLQRLLAHFQPTSTAVWLPILLATLTSLALVKGRRLLFALFLLLLTADLLVFFFGMNRPVDGSTFYPNLPSIQKLGEGHKMAVDGSMMPTRVMSLGRGIHPNILLAYGIANFEKYASALPHQFRRVFSQLNSDSPLPHQLAAIVNPESLTPGLLDLFGVSTLYNHPPEESRRGGEPQLSIIPRQGALRAFVCETYEVADSSRIFESNFDPRDRVLLEKLPGFSSSKEANFREVEVEYYTPHTVKISVEAQSQTLLVLTDLHYPGWVARVNGQESEVLRAYGLVRAVELKAGENKVEFRFRPTGWRGCLFTMTLGLVLLTIVGFRGSSGNRLVKSPN